jgi:hypothetical protein
MSSILILLKNSWWWTEEVRNMWFHSKNKFKKLVHLVGFIIGMGTDVLQKHAATNLTPHPEDGDSKFLWNTWVPLTRQHAITTHITIIQQSAQNTKFLWYKPFPWKAN